MAQLAGEPIQAQHGGCLTGKVALITGSTRGIGRGIALAMARAGAKVIISGRDAASAAAVVAEIGQSGSVCAFVAADLESDADVDALVPNAIAAFGDLDILVNNAGIDPFGPALETSPDVWRRTQRINLETPFRLSQAAARHFLTKGSGVVINITSVLGLIGLAEHSAYTASKHGLIGLTKVLALEWAREGIRVNAIAPGLILTEMSQAVWGDEAAERIRTRIPAGRIGQPDDIAGVAVFLASDEAGYVHGQVIAVDGGRLAS